MSHYKPNLRDIEFNLFEWLGRDQCSARASTPNSTPTPPARCSPR